MDSRTPSDAVWMDENEFWAVIDRSRAGNETDTVAQEEALEQLLTALPTRLAAKAGWSALP
jgi:hypothetical protein